MKESTIFFIHIQKIGTNFEVRKRQLRYQGYQEPTTQKKTESFLLIEPGKMKSETEQGNFLKTYFRRKGRGKVIPTGG